MLKGVKIRENFQHFAKNLWRWKCGIPELPEERVLEVSELRKSEWSDEFERLMRNRLLFGAFRYGLLRDSTKPQFDRISSAIARLKMYQEDGNLEHLVDASNLCMAAFVCEKHPKRHFSSQDDSIHARRI